jgi:hypothetical protein
MCASRPRFRIRHLLALQAVSATALAMIVVVMSFVKEVNEAIRVRTMRLRALEKVGVVKDDDGELRIVAANPKCTDNDCELLLAFADEIVDLDLHGSNVTNDAAEFVARLAKLRSLDVSDTSVSAQFFAGIQHLDNLIWLNAAGTQLGNDAIDYIVLLPVRRLDLRETNVDDCSLRRMRSLKALREVDLQGTAVTKNGVQEFQRSMKDVRVKY